MADQPARLHASRPHGTRGDLLVLVAAVALGLAAGEIGLRVADVQVASAGDGTIADPRLLHRGDPAFPEHDSRGFRNREALDRAEVVLLGDSMTYGLGVPVDDSWARVLAEQTGMVVYNMAIPGWGPFQAAFVLPDALALKPKRVLHGFFFGNDFLNALEMQAPGSLQAPAARPPLPCREYFEQTSGGRGFFSRHSRIWGLARTAWRTVRPYSVPDDADAARRAAERDPDDDVTFFEDTQWWGALRAPYRLCALDDSDPRIRDGVEIATSTLLAMARNANDAGAAFAVVLLPTKESVFAPRVANLGDHEGLAGLVAAESRLRGELATVLRANGIAVLDLLRPLRAAPEQPWPGWGMHPNVTGSRVIGLEAARFVRGMRRRPTRCCEIG